MLKKILVAAGVALLILLSIVLINTYRAKPWPVYYEHISLNKIPDSAVAHMSEAIRIQTISVSDTAILDTAAFKNFEQFLSRAYPLIHQKTEKTTIETFSYVFKLPGSDPKLRPIILMGHYDVVPVEPAAIGKWTVEPFSGKITDSCVWGRGACDDKYGVISIMEAVEAMLRKGFSPARTIYLCFGHDEEIRGRGANAIVDWFAKQNIRAEMVLDEGGVLTVEKTKEVKRPIAAIGVAEKGYSSFELSVEKAGGHSSIPAHETAIDILSKALYKLRSNNPAAVLTPELQEFLRRVGSSSSRFESRMAASNMWLFSGVAKSIIASEPEGEAMMHSTIVPTIIDAGIKDNVIPTFARAIINTRILSGESSGIVEDYIRKSIDDDRVAIKRIGKFDSDPSPATSSSSPAFKRVESAIYKTVPKVIPAPYQMVGATDSRFYRKISDGVVNFFPMTDPKGFHGIDERITLIDLQRGIHFVMKILEESGKEF